MLIREDEGNVLRDLCMRLETKSVPNHVITEKKVFFTFINDSIISIIFFCFHLHSGNLHSCSLLLYGMYNEAHMITYRDH